MKVKADDVAIWMNQPVTAAYLASINQARDSDIKFVTDGNCTTIENYHYCMGVLRAQEIFLSPIDIMREQEFIVEEESNDE